jgi:hypothetical protein
MAVRSIRTPRRPLYRVGRGPDPLAWAPWWKVGDGRFDDPLPTKAYRVLNAGERRACFLEVLADFRPALTGVVEQHLTPEWIESRWVARFTLDDPVPACRWLDLRAAETMQTLRRELAPELVRHGLADLDVSTTTGPNLDVTPGIGRWAFESGFCGIVYVTRFAPRPSCWAIFERSGGPRIAVADVRPLDRADRDFEAVRRMFGLTIPAGRPG